MLAEAPRYCTSYLPDEDAPDELPDDPAEVRCGWVRLDLETGEVVARIPPGHPALSPAFCDLMREEDQRLWASGYRQAPD